MQQYDNRGFWHNYRTGEQEFIETPTDFSDYVPQIGARGLYQCYVAQGMTPHAACIKVLEVVAGLHEGKVTA